MRTDEASGAKGVSRVDGGEGDAVTERFGEGERWDEKDGGDILW